ncbi:MAG: peroxide stress protein YaaA [Actinomyces sp.]|uniref:YaaA family protein n=1 Tax=Actinomyces sp. TaxID=29317 RepID=UPI0026DD41F3|nr:peroxide stress protein YaaA [Actinomyces sp.]MDO4242580.1 peroxide stress protein YaaA [Actinomyces sp.]
MLILIPPSEGKSPPSCGPSLDLYRLLGADRLTEGRRLVIDELSQVSAGPRAAEVLGLGPRSAAEARLNLVLGSAPCAPAHELFSGVLYDAAGLAVLAAEPATREVLEGHVVIFSGLWGALRPTDPVPDHRLSMAVSLPSTGRLSSFWRAPLAPLLNDRARRAGLVVDCRSGAYTPAWTPPGTGEVERVTVRVMALRADGSRVVVSHAAKHTRGLLVGMLVRALGCGDLETGASVEDVAALAREVPGLRGAELGEPDRRGGRVLTLVV